MTAPAAAEGLRSAREWLTQPGSGEAGLRQWDSLRRALRNLRTHPYLGPPSADHRDHRQLVVAAHRILYRVDPDTGNAATAGDIRIVAVFGPGQH